MCYFSIMKSNTYVLGFFLAASLWGTHAMSQEPAPVVAPAEAEASSEIEPPKTVAIQDRPYILNKELGLYYAYLPLDHFNHFHAFGLNYLNYFNDYFAWEVFNAATVAKQTTGLEDRLLNDYGAVPDTFDILQYYYTTGVVYTPIYMKHLYNNKEIRFGDISFVAGGGIARFEKTGNSNMIEAGVVTRFIGQQGFNLKLDVRYKYFTNSDLRPNLSMGLALTYNFAKEAPVSKALDEE